MSKIFAGICIANKWLPKFGKKWKMKTKFITREKCIEKKKNTLQYLQYPVANEVCSSGEVWVHSLCRVVHVARIPSTREVEEQMHER